MRKSALPPPELLRISTTRTDGATVFGATPKIAWEHYSSPDRQNRVSYGNYSMLIDHPDGWILVNAGPGDKPPQNTDVAPVRSRSSLLRDLRDRCITPKDIALVVLTHLHEEYAGGATHMTSSGKVVPTFSNARYVVQRRAYEAALHPNERCKRLYRTDDYEPLDDGEQLILIDGEQEVAPRVWVEPAPGPTPGHQVLRAEAAGTTYAFLGQLVPTTLHLRSAVLSASDWDPDLTMESKRDVLYQAAKDDWQVAPVGMDGWTAARNVVEVTERDAIVPAPAVGLPALDPLPSPVPAG